MQIREVAVAVQRGGNGVERGIGDVLLDAFPREQEERPVTAVVDLGKVDRAIYGGARFVPDERTARQVLPIVLEEIGIEHTVAMVFVHRPVQPVRAALEGGTDDDSAGA